MLVCAEQGIIQEAEKDLHDAEQDVQEVKQRLEAAQKHLQEMQQHHADVRVRLETFKDTCTTMLSRFNASYTALTQLKSPKRRKLEQK